MKRDEFYPCVLRSEPPTVLTRAEVDEYFRKRGAGVRVTHIPATNPRPEHTSADDLPIPANHHRVK